MGRPIGALWAGPAEEFRLPLAVLAACFLAGGLAGCLLSARTGEMGEAALTELLRAYVAQAALRPAEPAPLAVVLWETFRWPLLVLILGFTTLGLLFLPLVFAARGFLFSFAVTSFVRMLGVGARGWPWRCSASRDARPFRRCLCWGCRGWARPGRWPPAFWGRAAGACPMGGATGRAVPPVPGSCWCARAWSPRRCRRWFPGRRDWCPSPEREIERRFGHG